MGVARYAWEAGPAARTLEGEGNGLENLSKMKPLDIPASIHRMLSRPRHVPSRSSNPSPRASSRLSPGGRLPPVMAAEIPLRRSAPAGEPRGRLEHQEDRYPLLRAPDPR